MNFNAKRIAKKGRICWYLFFFKMTHQACYNISPNPVLLEHGLSVRQCKRVKITNLNTVMGEMRWPVPRTVACSPAIVTAASMALAARPSPVVKVLTCCYGQELCYDMRCVLRPGRG